MEENTKQVMVAYTRSWLCRTRKPALLTIAPDASPVLRVAINEQNRLGWDQWFKGRISRNWGELYLQNMINTDQTVTPVIVERWGVKMIRMIFKFVLDSWQTRNDMEHGMDGDPIRTKKDKLIRQIMRQRDKLIFIPNTYLRNLNREQLENLPLDNLEMTAAQLKILLRANPNVMAG
jgi:hypothetical protein